MLKSNPLLTLSAVLVAAFSFAVLAQIDVGGHPLGGVTSGVEDGEDTAGVNVGALSSAVVPTLDIDVPSDDPHLSTTSSETVSGTTANTPTSVTWRIGAGGETACSNTPPTFSCAVTGLAVVGNNTITVTASNLAGASTTTDMDVVLNYRPAPVVDITVPAANPSAVGPAATTTVSGTVSNLPTGVTWATTCVPGPTACTVPGNGTFTCAVTQTQNCAASDTVSVVGTTLGGTGSDTSGLLWQAFYLAPGTTTPNDLPTSLTINNVVLDLVESCNATSAGGLTCTPDTVTATGAGAAPTTTTLTPFHAFDATERGLKFAASGKRLDPATSSTFNLTTEDFVVVIVTNAATSGTFIDKSLASTAGWKLGTISGTGFRLSLRTASTTINVDSAFAAADASLIYGFVDRDEVSTNGSVLFTNGTAGTGVDMSSRAASLSNAVVASIGAASGATASLLTMHTIRVFKCPASNKQCFVGGAAGLAEHAQVARDWTSIAFGLQPTLAAGINGPTTMTRVGPTSVDIVDGLSRHIYSFSRNAPSVSRRVYNGVTYTGLTHSVGATTIYRQSENLGVTHTFPNGLDTAILNSWVTPLVLSGAIGDDIECVGITRCQESIATPTSLTAAPYTFWRMMRSGQQTEVFLVNDTIGNTTLTYFDLAACATCTVGEDNCAAAINTTGSAVLKAWARRYPVDSDGDGAINQEACLVGITFMGTAASHTVSAGCAEADGDALLPADADSIANCGVALGTLTATAFPSDYISITSLDTISVADDIRFSGTSHYGGSPSTINARVLCPNYDVPANITILSVGTGTTDYARIGINASSDRPHADGARTGAQWDFSGSAGDVADYAIHALRNTLTTNNVNGFFDGALFGTDTSNILPTSASSSVYLGTRGGTAQHSACMLVDFGIYGRDVSCSEVGCSP